MSDLLNYSAEADLEARRQADVDAAEESGPGPVTGAELERRARSLATAFVARCNRADLDPRDVLEDRLEAIDDVGDDVDGGDGPVTDGGFRSLDCWVNRDHLDGVAEQDDTCQNGEERCPGPDVDFSETLPCFDCFLDGGGGDA